MAGLGKRFLIAGLALWLAFVGVRALWLASLTPEEHVRRRLAEMAQGFNDTRPGPCLAGLDPALAVEPEGTSRDTLRRALAALFLRANDPEARRFAWRVALPEEELTVLVDPADEGRAEVELTARFDHSVHAVWQPAWAVRVAGEMEEREDRGWVFVRARAETIEGRRPRL